MRHLHAVRSSCALIALLCMSSPGCGSAPAGEADAGAGCPTACDDQLFCNGVEQCVEGACTPGVPPCGGQLRCVEAELMCRPPCETPDGDGDGVDSILCGGPDCDDDDPNRFPGNLEACDLVDQDCDPSTVGTTDGDEDGAVSAECCNGEVCGPDCDDAEAAVGPAAGEACNEADDDCDGDVDEGVQRLFWPDTDGDGFGATGVLPTRGCLPVTGQVENTLDCADDNQSVNPTAAEVCNGADDNCNGTADDPTLSAIACTTAFGSPARTTMACEQAMCTIAACGGTYQDCNEELSDGCETDTARDGEHCGACGNECGLFAACVEGVCDRVVDVEAGRLHACAVLSTGRVACWGGTRRGQGGDFSTADKPVPSLVLGLTDAIEVDSGGQYSCALTPRGVDCWGGNDQGQNGSGLSVYREPLPRWVFDALEGGEVLGVSAGMFHACAWGLWDDPMSGALVPGASCWGSDFKGALGRDFDPTRCVDSICTPALVPNLQVIESAAGREFSCFRTATGTYCAGTGASGVLGVGSMPPANTGVPLEVVNGAGLVELAAGDYHICARRSTGVVCWGSGLARQNGDAGALDRLMPGAVAGTDGTEVALCSAITHSCALRTDGTVRCWGDGSRGQLGRGTLETSRATALEVTGLSDVVDVSCGGWFTCALTAASEVYCWGDNTARQLGSLVTAASMSIPTPTRIPEL